MLLRKLTSAIVDNFVKFRSTAKLDLETGAVIRIVSPATGLPTATISTDELSRLDAAAGNRLVNLTAATLSLTLALHDTRTVTVNRAAGSTITLPASTGSGAKFKVVIGTTLTSGSLVVQVANSTDVMQGQVQTMSDDPATLKGFATAASSDTITWNRTTTGVGTAGEYVFLEDIAAGFWLVHAVTTSSGTESTPFTAAV